MVVIAMPIGWLDSLENDEYTSNIKGKIEFVNLRLDHV